jgi:hypothetical protein
MIKGRDHQLQEQQQMKYKTWIAEKFASNSSSDIRRIE